MAHPLYPGIPRPLIPPLTHSATHPQITAAKIRELARAKDAAVAREDYDEAKRIKAGIDRLKVRVGQDDQGGD